MVDFAVTTVQAVHNTPISQKSNGSISICVFKSIQFNTNIPLFFFQTMKGQSAIIACVKFDLKTNLQRLPRPISSYHKKI